MLDGARNALLGYLFQLLGTAAICVREVAVPGNDAWAELVARVDNGKVRCEEFGQDAVVRPLGLPNQGVTAIQFKYSATENPIERPELIEILHAFDRSRRDAAVDGVTISQYVLISNRKLDVNAQQLVVDGQSSSNPPDTLHLQVMRNGQPVAKNVTLLEAYRGNANEAAAAWHAVLRSLTIPPNATFEGDLVRLRKFAARYGVLESEWDARLNALVGALITETANGTHIEVTREWMKGHVAGDPDAANLQFSSAYQPHISSLCLQRLDEHAPVRHRIRLDYVVPRNALKTIRDETTSNSVVFVFGDGGCGKSLFVEEYLRSVYDRQLVWSELASNATETRLVESINRVRSPNCHAAFIDRFLSDLRRRLNVANPSARLLFTIDLDGIDEAPDRRGDIHDLINLCWAGGRLEESPASLVITCRSPASGDVARAQLVSQWIGIPEPDLVRGVGFVRVEDFADQELREAAELLSGRPERRIAEALDPHLPASRSGRFPDSKPISAEILQSLRHPVVWGGYASLPAEQDRDGVLDGDSANLAVLANQLLNRFLLRCCARKNWSDSHMLHKALRAVARAINGSPPYTPEDWQRGCAGLLLPTEAAVLYNESLSYGLVRREAGAAWRWGHRFVVDFLVNQPDPRGE